MRTITTALLVGVMVGCSRSAPTVDTRFSDLEKRLEVSEATRAAAESSLDEAKQLLKSAAIREQEAQEALKLGIQRLTDAHGKVDAAAKKLVAEYEKKFAQQEKYYKLPQGDRVALDYITEKIRKGEELTSADAGFCLSVGFYVAEATEQRRKEKKANPE